MTKTNYSLSMVKKKVGNIFDTMKYYTMDVGEENSDLGVISYDQLRF